MGELVIENRGCTYGITEIEVMHGGKIIQKLSELLIPNGSSSNPIHLEPGSYEVVVASRDLRKAPEQVIINAGKTTKHPVYNIP